MLLSKQKKKIMVCTIDRMYAKGGGCRLAQNVVKDDVVVPKREEREEERKRKSSWVMKDAKKATASASY